MTDTLFPDNDPFEEERQRWGPLLEQGQKVTCRCCGQTVGFYKRKPNESWARFVARLGALYIQQPRHYANREIKPEIGSAPKAGDDSTYLANGPGWGLISRHPEMSGHWVPTQRGMAWLRGEIRVPAFCHFLMGKPYRWSEETVSFADLTGTRFVPGEWLPDPYVYEP